MSSWYNEQYHEPLMQSVTFNEHTILCVQEYNGIHNLKADR